MTYQVEDWVHYHGDKYELLRDTSRQLPFLDKFGIKIGAVSTACQRGYIAEYEIVDDHLYLRKLSVESVNLVYPEINGVKSVDGTGDYIGLFVLMPIDGTIVIGADMPEDWLPADIRSIHDYRKVLKLRLLSGVVQSVDDLSQQAAIIRNELLEIFAERLRNPNWSPVKDDQHSERVRKLQDISWAFKNDKKVID